MKKAIVVCLFVLFGLTGYSEEVADVTINLKTAKAEYILGEEINFEYQAINNGDKEFRIAYGGFSPLSPFIRFGTIGPVRKECNIGRPHAEWGGKGYSDFKAGEKSKVESFSHLQIGSVDEGEYEVWVEYNSTSLDSSWDKYSVPRTVIQSNHIKFRIVKPTGIDLEVYNKYHNSCNQITLTAQDLLQKFPTSTYAAYAVCPPNQWTSNTDPEKILKAIESGSYLSSGSVIDDTGKSKDGYLYLGGKELVEYRTKWIGIVLKNHPDIWYADDLRLRLAVDQIALKNYKQGESDLRNLSEENKGEVAEKARRYLDLMKQKGWIKEEEVKTKEVDRK